MSKFSIKEEIRKSQQKLTVGNKKPMVLITGASSQIGREFIDLVNANWVPDNVREYYYRTNPHIEKDINGSDDADVADSGIPKDLLEILNCSLGSPAVALSELFHGPAKIDDGSKFLNDIYDIAYMSSDIVGLAADLLGTGEFGEDSEDDILTKHYHFCECDLSQYRLLYNKMISDIKPDIIINLAAYNNIQKSASEYSYNVNVLAVNEMVKYCKNFNKKMIHISCDQIFNVPIESDINFRPSYELRGLPLNNIGIQKLLSEFSVNSLLDDGLIIRTSKLYSKYNSNIVKSLTKSIVNKSKIDCVSDDRFVPTAASNVAKHIYYLLLMDLPEALMGGTIHIVDNAEPMSSLDLAQYISYTVGKNVHIDKTTVQEYCKLRELPEDLPNNTAMEFQIAPHSHLPQADGFWNYNVFDDFNTTMGRAIDSVKDDNYILDIPAGDDSIGIV